MLPFKKEYQYFLTLCQTLNISKASELIGIGQAGISKSLKTLETEIGGELFYRTTRGLKITPYGEALKKSLLKTQEHWEDSFDLERRKLEGISGYFKIGFHPSIAMSFSKHFLPTLIEDNEQLDISVLLERSSTICEKVINHECDLGIVAGALRHPDLIIKKLRREYIACWSSKKKGHRDTLYYNPEMINVVKILKEFEGYKKVKINNYEVLASIAKSSSGIFILPNSIAERHSYLKQIGPKIKEVDVSLIYHYEHSKTLAFKKLLNIIIDSIKN